MPHADIVGCYSTGGLLALGAEGSTNKEHYMGLAADIAHTCHESYDRAGGCCHRSTV